MTEERPDRRRRWSRRERRLAQAGAATVLGLVAIGLAVWWSLRPPPGYVPGEELEGLTAALERNLPDDRPELTFTEVTAEAGIDFRHFPTTRSSRIVEDMGSGVAWGDYDGDGWVDLFVVNAAPEGSDASSVLYRNRGDGTFEDVTAAVGLEIGGLGMGALWGDWNGDGRLDLAVSGQPQLRLFVQDASGRFSDRSRAAGLSELNGFWAGLATADYDRDGDLDLYVTGYVQWDPATGGSSSQYDTEVPASLNPSAFEPERNLLLRNRGDGTFQEVARSAGVDDPQGRGLQAAWADFDDDGWPDLYVANDVSDNALFLNQGDGTFRNVSHPALVADYRGAMGIATGDWDGDRDLDLFLTHWIAQENALYSNLLSQLSEPGDTVRRLQFRDDADRFGLGQIALDYVGWATSFLDFDNDGRLDLYVVNGSTFQRDDDPSRLIGMRDQLFWNGGRQRGFFDIGPVSGDWFSEERVGRGGAAADYDRDGDLDLFVVNHSGAGALLRNDGTGGAWLRVRLAGRSPAEPVLGAAVELFSGDSLVAYAPYGSQAGYLSQNEETLHFGLGPRTRVDSLRVRWPDGTLSSTGPWPAGGVVELERGGPGEWTQPLPALSERERVQRFWTAFRAAGQARVAGDRERSLSLYRDATRLDPDHEDALYYLGHMAREEGDFEVARQAWSRLVQVNDHSARAFSALGWLHLCAEPGAPTDPTRAAEAFRSVIGLNPEHTGIWVDASIAALANGDPGQSREYLEHVLQTDPDNPAALLISAYHAWSAGDEAGARSEFQKRAVKEAAGPEASAEGDTKSGVALTAEEGRCSRLRRLPREQGTPERLLPELDSLLLRVRRGSASDG